MRQEDKAAPPETSPLWGGWEHRVPQRKTGARLSPSAPHRPPGGSQTPELALSTPPPPIAAPTYPCSGRPGRSRAGAGAAGQGVPTSLRAETGLSTGHTGMLPPSPGTVPPQHPPNPGTVPVSRPPARHRSGSPSRDWGGGGGCPRLGCPPPPSAAAVPAGRSRSMVRRRSGRRRFMGRPEGAAGGSAVTHREPPSDPHPAPAPPPGHDRRPHRPLRVPRPAFLPRPTSPVPPPLRPGPTSHGPCPTALRVRLCPTRGTVPRADGSTLPAAPRRASTVAASRATPRPAFPTARAGLPPRAPPPPTFRGQPGKGELGARQGLGRAAQGGEGGGRSPPGNEHPCWAGGDLGAQGWPWHVPAGAGPQLSTGRPAPGGEGEKPPGTHRGLCSGARPQGSQPPASPSEEPEAGQRDPGPGAGPSVPSHGRAPLEPAQGRGGPAGKQQTSGFQ